MADQPDAKTILWHSVAPWAQTGYGVQTNLFASRVAKQLGHKVIYSATWGLDGHAIQWDDTFVLPRDNRYGNLMLPDYAKRFQADLVVALLDSWVLHPERMRDLNLAVWAPVDHQPCPPRVANFFRMSGSRPIAMSRFGEQMLRDEGLDPLYVPHGVETDVYEPLDRDEVRMADEKDTFIVGIVANNSGGSFSHGGIPRKAFPQMFMAFSYFYREHPNARLYIHSELSGRPGIDNGINLPALLTRFEIPPEAVKFTDQVQLELGIAASDMARLYNKFDVLLNPSYGEGFGVPIIEAQACGTPVIVTNFTSMPELCGAGWVVDGELVWDTNQDSFWMGATVGGIVAALEEAYEQAAGLRGKAREFALRYDADSVLDEYWKPALDELLKPREVPPLPNRTMRRAAKKKAAA